MKKYEFCVIDAKSTMYVYRYKDGKCRPHGPFYVKWKTGRVWRTLSGEKVLRAVRGKLAKGYTHMVAKACRDAGVYTVHVDRGLGYVSVNYGGVAWARSCFTVQTRPWVSDLIDLLQDDDRGEGEVSPTDALHVVREYAGEEPGAAKLLKAMTEPGERREEVPAYEEELPTFDEDYPF